MPDDTQRRGLIADLTRRLALASHDELRVVDAILVRLELGRERYGLLDVARPRDWRRELREELLDAVVYDVAEQLAADDLARANLRDAARAEMVGERDPSPGKVCRRCRGWHSLRPDAPSADLCGPCDRDRGEPG